MVRSEAILSNFSIVAWIGLSQQPQLNKLQHRLFEQITGDSVKDKTQSAELFLEQLIEAAKGQVILLVLDDLCTCNRCLNTAHSLVSRSVFGRRGSKPPEAV